MVEFRNGGEGVKQLEMSAKRVVKLQIFAIVLYVKFPFFKRTNWRLWDSSVR